MKISDKAVLRLIVVQYSDEFINMKKDLKRDTKIKKLSEDLSRLGIKELQLPMEFEYILHSSIKIICHIPKEFRNQDFDMIRDFTELNNLNAEIEKETFLHHAVLDYDRFRSTLKASYLDIINDHTIKEYKKLLAQGKVEEENLSNLSAEYVVLLFQYIWILISHWLSLDIYGMPSQFFINSLLSLLINEGEIIKPVPTLYYTQDPYAMLVRKENEFYRGLINEISKNKACKEIIDEYYNKFKENNDYLLEQYVLSEILNKNRYFYIKFEPILTKTNLIDSMNPLESSIDKLRKLHCNEVETSKMHFDTVIRNAAIFAEILLSEQDTISISAAYKIYCTILDNIENEKYQQYDSKRLELSLMISQLSKDDKSGYIYENKLKALEIDYRKLINDKRLSKTDFEDKLKDIALTTGFEEKFPELFVDN